MKRDAIHSCYFKLLNDCLLENIYKNKEENRFLGIDGTHIPLSINLKKNHMLTNKNNTYCIGFVSSVFDIDKEIVINYKLCKHSNERKGLMEQSKYLRRNDALLLDRGYFSYKLIHFLNDINVDYIFRLPKNSLIVKKINEKIKIT